jgi:hypothetical protein
MIDKQEISLRFKRLFSGNPAAYTQYVPSKDITYTVKETVTLKQYEDHLFGEGNSLGVIPVDSNGLSFFGVIDYDNHTQTGSIDLIKLEKLYKQHKAPCIICRSKRGGAHVYFFGSTPLDTALLKQVLLNYAEDIKGVGEDKIEVFPKQETLYSETDAVGNVSFKVGNGINLPYFQGDKTDRYAIIDGQQASLSQFLYQAESIRFDTVRLLELNSNNHKEAPPCIQSILKDVIGVGERNVALYNLAVYTKKAFPVNYETLLRKYNTENILPALPENELVTILDSVKRQSKSFYKCKEEPCKSRCNSSVCVLKKWGITPVDRNELMLSELPNLGKLTKYNSDPVMYSLEMEGVTITLTSAQLQNPALFASVVFERMDKVIKVPKKDFWLTVLDGLLKNIIIEDVPEEVSQHGMIASLCRDYTNQANIHDDGTDVNRRRLILSGHPVVQELSFFGIKHRYIIFRYSSFLRYIQSKKMGHFVNKELIWMALKEKGIFKYTLRVPGKGVERVLCLLIEGGVSSLNKDIDYNSESDPHYLTSLESNPGEVKTIDVFNPVQDNQVEVLNNVSSYNVFLESHEYNATFNPEF